jgi:hypothetical protein
MWGCQSIFVIVIWEIVKTLPEHAQNFTLPSSGTEVLRAASKLFIDLSYWVFPQQTVMQAPRGAVPQRELSSEAANSTSTSGSTSSCSSQGSKIWSLPVDFYGFATGFSFLIWNLIHIVEIRNPAHPVEMCRSYGIRNVGSGIAWKSAVALVVLPTL